MTPDFGHGHTQRRCCLIVGTAAVAVVGLAASPARADMLVQQTTSYASPPPIVVETPAPPIMTEAPPVPTVTYQAPPAGYVERKETVTTYAPLPTVTREVTVDVVQDTPKYDYTVHKRAQTAQVRTRTTQTRPVQRKPAPRCQCQPSQ